MEFRSLLQKMNQLTESATSKKSLNESGPHDSDFVEKSARHERLRALAKRTGDKEKFDFHNNEIKKLYGKDTVTTPAGTMDEGEMSTRLGDRGETIQRHTAKAGGYGRKIDTPDDSGDKFHSSDIDDSDAPAASSAVKRGRGRPQKGGDSETGIAKKYDTDALASLLIGKLPGKPLGKSSVKHKLRDWIERVERTQIVEGFMAEGKMNELSMIIDEIVAGDIDLKDLISGKFKPSNDIEDFVRKTLVKAYNQISTEVELDPGQDDEQIIEIIYNDIHDIMQKALSSSDLDEAEQVSIVPAQSQSQVIKQGSKVLGQVSDPKLAGVIKQAIGTGQMTLNSGGPMRESAQSKKNVMEGTLDEIIQLHPHEHKMCQEGWAMDESLYEALADHYFKEGRIPRKVWHGDLNELRKHVEECYLQDTQPIIDESDVEEGAIGQAIGSAVGTAAAGPVGGTVGGMVGSAIGDSMTDEATNHEIRRGAMLDLTHELDEEFAKLVSMNESSKDNKAEKAGKRVTKDIEYDEGHRGKDDAKAEKAGKRVTKDIEYDEKRKVEEGDEGKHNNGKTTGFKAVAKKAAKEYGSKAAGERVAGAVRNKMKKSGKLEEQQLDELSPKTLKSYVKDATKDAVGNRKDAANLMKKSDDQKRPDMARFYKDTSERRGAYADKREANIEKAKSRLTKEGTDEEQLDELSPKTLGSYVKKSAKDVEKKTSRKAGIDSDDRWQGQGYGATRSQRKESNKSQKDINKRQAGIGKAVDRLTSEGTDEEQIAHDLGAHKRKLARQKNRAEITSMMSADHPTQKSGEKEMAKINASNRDVVKESFSEWDSQLSSLLLNEEMTITTSQSSNHEHDSVNISATDEHASALLSIIQNAGLGSDLGTQSGTGTEVVSVGEPAMIDGDDYDSEYSDSGEIEMMEDAGYNPSIYAQISQSDGTGSPAATVKKADSDPHTKFDDAEDVPVMAMPRGMGMSQNTDGVESQVVEPQMNDEVIDTLASGAEEADDGGEGALNFLKKMLKHGEGTVGVVQTGNDGQFADSMPTSRGTEGGYEEEVEEDSEPVMAPSAAGSSPSPMANSQQPSANVQASASQPAMEEEMDPVGKEDDDIDNDGDSDSSDKYLRNRREKISKNVDEGFQSEHEYADRTVDGYEPSIRRKAEILDKESFVSNASVFDMSEKEAAQFWDSVNGVHEGKEECHECGGQMHEGDCKDDYLGEDEAEENPNTDEVATAGIENGMINKAGAMAGAEGATNESRTYEVGDFMKRLQAIEARTLREWANSPTGESQDEQFQTDMEFMTKTISGGLNNQKQDQTLVGSGPSRVVTQTERADVKFDMGSLLKKLNGIN